MAKSGSRLALDEICAILGRLRDSRGLTDQELGDQIGYGKSQVNAIRRGKIVEPPSDEKIEAWIRACASNDAAEEWALQEVRRLAETYERQRELEALSGDRGRIPVADGSGADGAPKAPRIVGVIPRTAACFQHRTDVNLLDQAVVEGGTKVRCQVLAGMGGVGKTQLAAHYAHRVLDAGAVDLLVWVTASSRNRVQTAYADAAAAVEVPGADQADPAAAAAAAGLLAWWPGWAAPRSGDLSFSTTWPTRPTWAGCGLPNGRRGGCQSPPAGKMPP